jgi:ectoine hydroxylase-related dioxygenase (phytanoyl-CoA dioxygenase family)
MIDLTSAKQLRIARDGVEVVENCVPDVLLDRLSEAFPQTDSNVRNGLELEAIREYSRGPVRDLTIPVLGERCFAVRAILFNKTQISNWKVAWHQDLVIAVKSRSVAEGFGLWSVKDGVPHVRPPASILETMLAVRIHLDDCDDDNGPLRVLPGTHLHGVFSDSEIAATRKEGEVVCSVKRGDAILMRPLTLHASSTAAVSRSRRVIHVEFASVKLPPPLEWHDAVM